MPAKTAPSDAALSAAARPRRAPERAQTAGTCSCHGLLQTLRGPADPFLDHGPCSLDPGPWTLGLGSAGYLYDMWRRLGSYLGHLGAILGHPEGYLGPPCGHLRSILGHPGAILGLPWENLRATWVQDHFVEMHKSFSLGPCAAKTLACQHISAHTMSCEVENVDFTLVL